jgi:hypothetical protein
MVMRVVPREPAVVSHWAKVNGMVNTTVWYILQIWDQYVDKKLTSDVVGPAGDSHK